MNQDKDLKLAEEYVNEGRKTIPVQIVKSLIEKLRFYQKRNSDYLDVIVSIIHAFAEKYEKEIKKQKTEKSDRNTSSCENGNGQIIKR